MKGILKQLRSPAMIVACIALVVALGGASYAAGVLPKNSVGSKQLKRNAVTSKKIKNGAVNSSKVKNGSLVGADFKQGELPAGPQGPQGPQGLQGPKGDTGAAGSAAAYALVSDDGTVNTAQAKNIAQANVTHSFGGTYCFSGLSFAPTNVIATINGNTGNGAGDAQASIFTPSDDPTSFNCPAGAQAVVYTIDNTTPAGLLADYAFPVVSACVCACLGPRYLARASRVESRSSKRDPRRAFRDLRVTAPFAWSRRRAAAVPRTVAFACRQHSAGPAPRVLLSMQSNSPAVPAGTHPPTVAMRDLRKRQRCIETNPRRYARGILAECQAAIWRSCVKRLRRSTAATCSG
jgi:hypothetical protein